MEQQYGQQQLELSLLRRRIYKIENVGGGAGVQEQWAEETRGEVALESEPLLNEEVDKRLQVGMENLMLSRAARVLFSLLASEISEMMKSCWSMAMLPILYYSPTKKYIYTSEDIDDNAFKQAMYFTSIDFAMELLTFSGMLLIFHLHLKIQVFAVGVEYQEYEKLFMPMLAVGCIVHIGEKRREEARSDATS